MGLQNPRSPSLLPDRHRMSLNNNKQTNKDKRYALQHHPRWGPCAHTFGFCLSSEPQLKGCWVGGARLATTQAGWLAAEEPPHFN